MDMTSGVFFDEKDTRRLLQNTALATSGPSAQFVEIDGVRYSHVVDPRTGWALTFGLTAHVIAGDAALADALATAATVLGTAGLERLRSRFPHTKIDLAPSLPKAGLGFAPSLPKADLGLINEVR